MKKVVLNISDVEYMKFSFEAIEQKKSIKDIIKKRVFSQPFSDDVNEAFDHWMQKNLDEILKEN